MVSVQQGSNDQLTRDIVNVMGLGNNIQVYYTINARNNVDTMFSIGRGSVHQYMGAPDVDLDLDIYVNQMSLLKKEDIFQKLEERISAMLHHVQGVFLQRQISPFRGEPIYRIQYKIKLMDYDSFSTKLHEYAMTQLDLEFREVLEETLTT